MMHNKSLIQENSIEINPKIFEFRTTTWPRRSLSLHMKQKPTSNKFAKKFHIQRQGTRGVFQRHPEHKMTHQTQNSDLNHTMRYPFTIQQQKVTRETHDSDLNNTTRLPFTIPNKSITQKPKCSGSELWSQKQNAPLHSPCLRNQTQCDPPTISPTK